MLAIPLLLASTVAACSAKSAVQDCGLPIALPRPFVFLAYPVSGATGVPDNLGTIVIGDYDSAFSTSKYSLTSANDVIIAQLAPPIAAPSPLPSPLAAGFLSSPPSYFGVPVPALSPETTYGVSVNYSGETNDNAACTYQTSFFLNTFTTQ